MISTHLQHLRMNDLLQDSSITATALSTFVITTTLTTVHVALILGVANLGIVAIFRGVEIYLRERRAAQDRKHLARIEELEKELRNAQPIRLD